jgi:hypothetical protein
VIVLLSFMPRNIRAFWVLVALLALLPAEAANTAASASAAPPGAWQSVSLTNVQPEATSDFDGNGVADAAVVQCTDDQTCDIDVQLANGAGEVRLPSPRRIIGLAAVDIDDDGDADLVALDDDGEVDVWLNAGNQGFLRQQPLHPSGGLPSFPTGDDEYPWYAADGICPDGARSGSDTHQHVPDAPSWPDEVPDTGLARLARDADIDPPSPPALSFDPSRGPPVRAV